MSEQLTKQYRDRLRILLIIYFFSEPYSSPERSSCVGLFKTEVRIQKLDFLIRYPSYLCFELISRMREDTRVSRTDIYNIIKEIFSSAEPELRTNEMRRFLFGAWENLDGTISFLVAHGLIQFESKLSSTLKQYHKEYFLTQVGKQKVETALRELPSVDWYSKRCMLIKKYFGDLSGTELKALQYGHDTYKDATINTYITDIADQTRRLFAAEFNEEL